MRRASRNSRLFWSVNLLVEPGAGVGPVAVGRGAGDVQTASGVLDGQPSEEAQLHQPRLDGILRRQLREGFVHCQQIVRRRFGGNSDGVERYALPVAAVFSTLLPSRAFD